MEAVLLAPPADDIVRHGLRKFEVGGVKAWYDEAEGLVPPSVLGHIVRYGLYSRQDQEETLLGSAPADSPADATAQQKANRQGEASAKYD